MVEPASRTEHLTYLFFGFWTLIGLCLDGWAHRYQPELESFFTPWHAVFYTGFIGAAAYLALMIIRRRPQAPSLTAAIPDGYQLAVVGLIAFAVGGVGDGIWHTVFGIETSIDALLSPTHLLMLVGMLGGSTAPLRASWRNGASSPSATGMGDFLPVILSATLATTSVAFFFLYANAFNNWPITRTYEPGQDDVLGALGVLATLASTVILLAPVLLLLRRWWPPMGSFTLLFTLVGVFMAGLDAFSYWWQIIAPFVGGLTTDLIISRSRSLAVADPGAGRRASARWCGLTTPAVMWTVSTIAIHLAWEVRWPPELWLGSIVMASLTGWSMALVAFPPPLPPTPAPTASQPGAEGAGRPRSANGAVHVGEPAGAGEHELPELQVADAKRGG